MTRRHEIRMLGSLDGVLPAGCRFGLSASCALGVAGFVCVAALALTLQSAVAGEFGDVTSSDFTRKMKITFAGYSCNPPMDTLTNFPVLVVLSNGVDGSDFTYDDFVGTDGYDLTFTSSNGVTVIPHEVEGAWTDGGTNWVWVRVPELVDVNSYIWAYWGKSGATQPAYCTNGAAWANGYVGVWHLNEVVTDEQSSGTHYDSTSNANNGTQSGNDAAAGIAGLSQNFDGGNDTINVGNKSSLRPANITISAWIKPDSVSSATYMEIYRKEDGNDRHLFSFQNNGTILSFGIGPGGSYEELDVGITASQYTDGPWHQVAASYNGSTKVVYKDGASIGSVGASGVLSASGTANGYIGSSSGGVSTSTVLLTNCGFRVSDVLPTGCGRNG